MAVDASYEAGYRDGESSRTADVLLLFHDARTMDALLADFREVTGNPDLKWPEPVVDWRAMFAKYARSVQYQEGYFLLHESDWTQAEWAAITALPGMERPV